MRTLALVVVTACASISPATVPGPAADVAVPTTEATVETVETVAPIERTDLTAPFALTASDGSGLVLTRLDARAVVEGPLAYTELHLWFRNGEARQREGTFQITLPTGAAVSRFAMENRGTWMEAEVVPKLVARRAYEDFLHRRQDPALLERAAGNQFTARVFPIFGGEDKHLVISYSQELPGVRYVLPLRGLPRAARVDVELASPGRAPEKLAQRDWVPDRDFVSSVGTSAAAVGAGGLVAAQVEITAQAGRDEPSGLTILVDTSASRALGFERYVASVKKLVGELRAAWGDALPLQIVAFDQTSERVFGGRIGDAGNIDKPLLARGAAGASNLEQAVSSIGTQRVLIVTDGVVTAGAEHVTTAIERIDIALVGGLRDERGAATWARSGARAGAVLDLERDRVATAIGERVATNIAIDVPGASWVHPRSIPSARAGSKVMVFARMQQPARAITVVANNVRRTVRVAAGTQPLVERAIAGAEIETLEASLAEAKPDEARAIRSRIAKQSVAARVLSRETSMLVLESEADYPRYGLDRKALADVLVVGTKGVERVHRADITPIPTRPGATPVATDTVEPRASEPRQVVRTTRAGGDNDHDAILDVEDRCPSEPEAYNGFDDDDGCPDRGRVVVTDTSITILEAIHFEHGSGSIRRQSLPILDAVVATLLGNPDIQQIEIQGHTDERGDDAANLTLSERRAAAVRDYLVAHGVAPERLVAQGYGETQPRDQRHGASAWAKNRRVDFLILRRAESISNGGKGYHLDGPPPVTGELAEIQKLVAGKRLDEALSRARTWIAREPGNVLAIVALGETLEARNDANAARAYGSIIDLYPGRADLRRFAGERLMRTASSLAIDTFERAVADRPDHLTGHRLLAYALVREGRHADAFAAILAAFRDDYRATSFRGADRVLKEDAAMLGAAYAIAAPAKRAEITAALAKHQAVIATRPSTRFVLYWETDANDVDLHVVDAKGAHASYQVPKLPSGGELYADVTTGYGPECFVIEGKPAGGPYKLSLHYYAQGPMGYGMGTLQIQTFDPARGLSFEDRPYLIMTPHAKVDLGTFQ